MLIVKPEQLVEAQRIFADTGVKFAEGSHDLGGAIGSDAFTSKYLTEKVIKLKLFLKSQPRPLMLHTLRLSTVFATGGHTYNAPTKTSTISLLLLKWQYAQSLFPHY